MSSINAGARRGYPAHGSGETAARQLRQRRRHQPGPDRPAGPPWPCSCPWRPRLPDGESPSNAPPEPPALDPIITIKTPAGFQTAHFSRYSLRRPHQPHPLGSRRHTNPAAPGGPDFWHTPRFRSVRLRPRQVSRWPSNHPSIKARPPIMTTLLKCRTRGSCKVQ